jgi:hypothetical protein
MAAGMRVCTTAVQRKGPMLCALPNGTVRTHGAVCANPSTSAQRISNTPSGDSTSG